jgi:hypothetical protein
MDPQPSSAPSLPEPPALRRRIRVVPLHLIGVMAVSLLPVLALLGAFDEHRVETQARIGEVEVRISYPDRHRIKQRLRYDVFVHNPSATSVDDVRISIGEEWPGHFTDPVISPAPERAFEVALAGIEPGTTHRVSIDVKAEHSGRFRGAFSVRTGMDEASIPVSTFILP